MARVGVDRDQRSPRAFQASQWGRGKRLWDDRMRQLIIVIAILLVTTATQISASPQGGTFSEASNMAGKSILSHRHESEFDFFNSCNIGCYVFSFK